MKEDRITRFDITKDSIQKSFFTMQPWIVHRVSDTEQRQQLLSLQLSSLDPLVLLSIRDHLLNPTTATMTMILLHTLHPIRFTGNPHLILLLAPRVDRATLPPQDLHHPTPVNSRDLRTDLLLPPLDLLHLSPILLLDILLPLDQGTTLMPPHPGILHLRQLLESLLRGPPLTLLPLGCLPKDWGTHSLLPHSTLPLPDQGLSRQQPLLTLGLPQPLPQPPPLPPTLHLTVVLQHPLQDTLHPIIPLPTLRTPDRVASLPLLPKIILLRSLWPNQRPLLLPQHHSIHPLRTLRDLLPLILLPLPLDIEDL
jgi:hypothetical protein